MLNTCLFENDGVSNPTLKITNDFSFIFPIGLVLVVVYEHLVLCRTNASWKSYHHLQVRDRQSKREWMSEFRRGTRLITDMDIADGHTQILHDL